MEQDELNNLKAEYAKEREICSGANASELHKKRFAELKKELKITDGDGITEKPKNETVESTASEEPTVVSTNEEPEKQG
jgi:hypothetical protein